MTEDLFSINNDGRPMSATGYTITSETIKRKLLSDELIIEVWRRVNDPNGYCIPQGFHFYLNSIHKYF